MKYKYFYNITLTLIITASLNAFDKAHSTASNTDTSSTPPTASGGTTTTSTTSLVTPAAGASTSSVGTGTVSPNTGAAMTTDNSSGASGVVNPGVNGTGGQMNYQADLFTGRFTYSIPIKVPPGRQGAQPNLNLSYNSAGGNGWCGFGWSMEVGYIQRDTRKGVPIKWATTNALSQYDDSKGFIASFGGVSSVLVQVGATNQNPIVYRQQVDTSFLIYNYYTNNHWEVVDKSGNTFIFGEGITNQMENSKTNWVQGPGSSTFRWALDRVVDINGNTTYLNYTNDGGALYLIRILYNANINSPALATTHEVAFVLTNRPDTNFSFTSGYRVTQRKLLTEIDVKVSGSGVRKYSLVYTNSTSTLRSLLASVTEYGSDYVTSLPPISFSYQNETFSFGPPVAWPGGISNNIVQNGKNALGPEIYLDYNLTFNGTFNQQLTGMIDIDGNGTPDWVTLTDLNYEGGQSCIRAVSINPTNDTTLSILCGTNLPYTSYGWGATNRFPIYTTDGSWVDINDSDLNNATYVAMFDINGDGLPDRVMRNSSSPYTNFVVNLNQGNMFFGNAINWIGVTNDETTDYKWFSVRYLNNVDMVDINGDGLPDRVSRKVNPPYDRFKVQLNTGSGFLKPSDWALLDSQGDTSSTWNTIAQNDASGNMEVMLVDVNGDGLPDRVMRKYNSPYTNLFVQFNNGAGFEPAEQWGPLNNQGQTSADWNSPMGCNPSETWATLIDINGDGLPDRVMRVLNPPYTNWVVQLNTGSGFGPPLVWGGINAQGQTSSGWNSITASYNYSDFWGAYKETYVDFMDINGDGLPDRIMRNPLVGLSATPTNFVVELNNGAFPDLMCGISNGIGGSIQVRYTSSTTLNNRDKDWVSDPWAEGTKSLLPFNVWVVSQIKASDGMGAISTNTYAFKSGFYNWQEREFRGFGQATVTDPLGSKSTTYFHQSGGKDNSALGEYADQGSESKKGIPYRIDVIGNDGKTNKITLNKVQEVLLNSNGWFFPFISQSIVMTYEGLSSYRAVARQFNYDTNTENLVETANLGEVTNVVFQGQSFTDFGSDSIYTWIAYTNIGNILNKPSDVKNTSDSAGSNRLRETQMSYDSCGRMTSSKVWLDSAGAFISVGSNVYDQYGNLTQSTDAAGITTTTTYDSTYQQFPIAQVTGTFTNSSVPDIRSGVALMVTDAKGLVSSNAYDVFFRPVANYISTNAYGAPTLWQSRTYYSLGGISSGISYNYIHNQVNNAVDPVNGFETYAYSDGMGRTIQTREEAETGQFRVANVCYDLRGNPSFQTLSYFSSGTNFTMISGSYLGALTEYDTIGRAYRVTPAVQGSFTGGKFTSTSSTGGDTGSPVGSATTAFMDGGNLWATVVTDSEGKTKKSYRDAYGRTIMIAEVTSGGNYKTTYRYDLLGNPTNVTDSAGNPTMMQYDSLGRKTSMTDPDMGTWNYAYDNAGRMTQQIDARTNIITFTYSDQLGRLTSKQIFNAANSLVGTITYTYDTSDDPNYTVLKGQLYKVTDLQGYERSSYDIRGRVLKSGRFLNLNSMEYVTQAAYDDVDRVRQLTYPGNAAIINYTYDTAGNLIQVKSLAGTGTQEIFYTAQSFNALGQLTGYTNGNHDLTLNTYYSNSKRLQNVQVTNGTNSLQNLSYTYDTVSDVKSINDGVYSGAASASISSVTYDDLYRVTSLNSTARGIKTYGYNSIGNIMTNQDFGSGLYSYAAKPHAVTSANGMTYAYDACGNMTTRGSQTLTFDEQNQLIRVATTNDTVTFGYDDDGERLWRNGTNGYSVWVGGVYEINNGKVLCHVIADGQLVATFEPQCGGLWSKVMGEKNWYITSTTIQSILNWPFQKGRSQISVFAGTWVAILGVCILGGRRIRLKRLEVRKAWRPASLWNQAVTIVSISAFLWVSTEEVQAAPTYNPVFYYYHTDALGSSNVLTDRSGNLVQHYEYGTFGQTSYSGNSSAYSVSNRYTGQIADDETGLYYYGARFYDPQLGRFIQADTNVQSPDNPQTLNRYSYCGNNPLNYVDPSGNFSIITGLIGAVLGAIAGGIIAGATGHNILTGIAGGAIGGFLLGCGISYGGAEFATATGLSSSGGAAIGGALGGAAGGAANASITGGNVGQSALIGGILGGIVGSLDPYTTDGQYYNNDFSQSYQIPLLTPNEASASGGAATAVSTAATNHSIGEPSTLVSMIPVYGSLREFSYNLSAGNYYMATAFAAMAVLDVTGVGEVGDLALKGGLKLLQKDLVHIAERHAFNTAERGVSKFAQGTTVNGLREMINETIEKGIVTQNTLGRSGQIYLRDLGRTIGQNSRGVAVSRLKVVVRPNGSVVTAFPH